MVARRAVDPGDRVQSPAEALCLNTSFEQFTIMCAKAKEKLKDDDPHVKDSVKEVPHASWQEVYRIQGVDPDLNAGKKKAKKG